MAEHPDEFLEVRVHELDLKPGLTGLCAGYEACEWRCQQLAAHLIEWLPDFALDHAEKEGMGSHNAAALLAKAARAVYTSDKYQRRGELGELLLHIVIRQVFETVPAISKYFFKDSSNDTVKGFDAVHVVTGSEFLELWLGEVKFYCDIVSATRDVVEEINKHVDRDYLRSEFALISNKIDDNWAYAERLKKLLHRNTSLDEIFDAMCIPVCLTYESNVIKSHSAVTSEFKAAFSQEVRKHHADFATRALPSSIRIHLFLLPMREKEPLVREFDERLKKCQGITN